MKAITLAFTVTLLLSGCGAGYHRVRYAEMPHAPTVTLSGKELIVTTRNPESEGLSVYKIDINIRDRVKTVELKGWQAIGKPEKTEFKIELTETQLKWIERYSVYWIDPGGKKSRVELKVVK